MICLTDITEHRKRTFSVSWAGNVLKKIGPEIFLFAPGSRGVATWMNWIVSEVVVLLANCSTRKVQRQKSYCHQKCMPHLLAVPLSREDLLYLLLWFKMWYFVIMCCGLTVPTSSVRDLTPVSIENWPNAISLNWQPPRQTNGQITGTFSICLLYTSPSPRD